MRLRNRRSVELIAFLLLNLAYFAPRPVAAQTYPYNSSTNDLYWNDRPSPTRYWQQDVHYKIDAQLDAKEEIIYGKQVLTYWNNSPDTLREVYFHLYQNAFVKDSYFQQLQRANHSKPELSRYERDGKGTELIIFAQNKQPVAYVIDNTVCRVELNSPILPGDSTVFNIEFATYFGRGSQRRRMKVFDVPEVTKDGALRMVKHFDVVHWYPRICVYDKKFSWHVDQHLSKEFYGNFGAFDVDITAPGNYIMDGTGVMTNRNQVLPPELMNAIDIRNFSDKKAGQPARQILSDSLPPKTWKFRARNVHDFAWTADPTYRVGITEWDGVKCVALAREENAWGWQDAADYTAKLIELFSTDFGRYAYPKMIVADARDGMEYPMLTLDGGVTPKYKSLLAHEVGHNWFFGMVGSNETYRAFMDEGFTQFLTGWAMEHLEDGVDPEAPNQDPVYHNVYYGYLLYARKGYDGHLNTHSDDFHNALSHGGGYAMVYYKAAAMLYNLQYALGRDLFLGAMQHYVEQWRFRHPYPEDFRNSITEYVGYDLTWFFDQWIETDKKIDYAVANARYDEEASQLHLKFRRKGGMQMPVEFSIISSEGDTLDYLIPNTYFVKSKYKKSGRVLPRWYGWGKLNPTYSVSIDLPNRFVYSKTIIDPSRRLADVNLLNNSSETPLEQSEWQFMAKDKSRPDWEHYQVDVRPNLWWDGFSGLAPGLTLDGSYFGEDNRLLLQVWGHAGAPTIESPNAELRQYDNDFHRASYNAVYETRLPLLGRNGNIRIHSAFRAGLQRHGFELSKTFAKESWRSEDNHRVFFGYNYLYRSGPEYLDYLLFPEQWTVNQSNASIFAGIEQNYAFREGSGNLVFQLRGTGPGGDARFGVASLETLHERNNIFKAFDLRFRTFAQYAEGRLPLESKLYLSGASPENYIDNDFMRARGFFPRAWLDNSEGTMARNVYMRGGLNLRGYAGRQGFFAESQYPDFMGEHGASANIELDFEKLSPVKLRFLQKLLQLETYIFYDAGVIGSSVAQTGFDGGRFAGLRQDAGFGALLTLKTVDLSRNQHPVKIRLDFPLWLSDPVENEKALNFRWLISIEQPLSKTF